MLLGLAGLAIALWRARQEFPADDACFFLRYAEHVAHGEGYAWNPGVHDAIGASAPLWPLLLALPIAAGIEPWLGMQMVSSATGMLAFLVLLVAARRIGGPIAPVLAALVLAGGPATILMTMGGMETPLTLLLLAVAVWLVTTSNPRPTAVAALAGLLVAHKVDLLPWAVGLLFATRMWRPGRRSALWIGLAVLATHAAWMLWATGSVLPASFLRKLANSAGGGSLMPHSWFLSQSFWRNRRWFLLPVTLVGAWQLGRERAPLGVLLAVGGLGQIAAYSLYPPTEPFFWYCAPMELLAAVLASRVAGDSSRIGRRQVPLGLLTAGLLAALVVWRAERVRQEMLSYSAHIEADRARAGQWVAAHTPQRFRVVTGFGLPAFYCRRFVLDASGLNTTEPYDLEHLIATHRPDVIIQCPFRTGIAPADFPPHSGYRVVQRFTTSLDIGTDFYAVVMVRDDVVGELRD